MYQIKFFTCGSTTEQIKKRIDVDYPGQLRSLRYCSPIANGECFKARLFDGRRVICIVKGEY